MIIVLYGADTYRSRKKLNEIISEYRNKAGGSVRSQTSEISADSSVANRTSNGINFHRFDVADDKPEDIKKALESGSLFSSKKLVVIERAFSAGEAFATIKSAVEYAGSSKETILVFWDGVLDGMARERLNEIQNPGVKSHEFKPLVPSELKKWIDYEAKVRGTVLKDEDFLRLAQFGSDLWKVANELDKIAVRGDSSWAIKRLTAAEPPSIFHLGDHFFTSRQKALPALLHLFDQGEDEFNAFSYLSNHARNVLLVKSCEEQRRSIPKSIAPHPFVAKKASIIARTIPLQGLQNGLRIFFEEDFKIKIGLSKPKESLVHMLFS